MDLHAYQSLFSTLWVVWFFILFSGIIYAVMRPKKRVEYQRAGDIPLRDDQPPRARHDRSTVAS